ncbi:nuclear receptor subfamily 0, group B, member 2b [Polymixia lowei]
MYPLEEKITNCTCPGYRLQHPHTILYNILSCRDSNYLNHNNLNHNATVHNCHCERRRAVCLKNPKATCQVASSVLVKTICFMRSLPSFSQLPPGDQLSLLRECWVPLFVLGLAQEKIIFEVTDVPHPSMLRQILLGHGQSEKEANEKRSQPTLAGVHKLKTCLRQLWILDLSPKEYAYLKGTMLFNPDVQGVSALLFIEGLQREAQRALQEVILLLHPEDRERFSHILVAACAIRTVSQNLVTELFFKPIIGDADLFELLREMLFVQQDYR